MNYNNYITKILIPYYNPMAKYDFMLGIVDSNNEYIFVTDCYAKFEDGENSPEFLKSCTQKYLEINTQRIQLISQLNTGLEYLEIFASDKMYLTCCLPIYYPDNKLFGYEFYMRKFNIQEHLELLMKFIHQNEYYQSIGSLCLTDEIDLGLTDKQAIILFLLMLGFSQFEVASFLNISRNTIKSAIADGICPKLGVKTTNMDFLIAKAIELKLYQKIRPSIIRIGESRVVARYDNCFV